MPTTRVSAIAAVAAVLGATALSTVSTESAAALTAPAATTASSQPQDPLPRCRSWTSFGWGDEDDHYWIRIPTTRRNNSQWDCALRRGDRYEGVKVLKVALNRCYGADLPRGPGYNRAVERVVTRVRDRHGLSGHGYDPALRERMRWPVYHNGVFEGCD